MSFQVLFTFAKLEVESKHLKVCPFSCLKRSCLFLWLLLVALGAVYNHFSTQAVKRPRASELKTQSF